MIDLKQFLQNPDKYFKSLDKRGSHYIGLKASLQEIIDVKSRPINDLEKLQAELNKRSKAIPQLSEELRNKEIVELRKLSDDIKQLKHITDQADQLSDKVLLEAPNYVLDDVPVGDDESGNQEIRRWGKPKNFTFPIKDHSTLGKELDIIDTETAVKVSGPRFSYLKGAAALLEYALVQYAFSILTSKKQLTSITKSSNLSVSDKPFTPIVPPAIIKPEVFRKMARLSDSDKDERYHLQKDDLYLIGSAEHTLGAMHMDETLNLQELPLRYVGFSSSFRREAGSYGKDTKGILRVHQFDKIEIESFTSADQGKNEQDFIVAIQESIMQQLDLPYRVVMICGGDMGKPDARQIDIETWLPSEGKYRETHTSDYNTDYQARRLKTKVKLDNDKKEFVHMNDATVLAIGRTLIAIIENYQQDDGSIAIPKVLQPYMNGLKKITSAK